MESSKNYDVDAIGISAQGYDTLIVFRDEDAFRKVIAANPNMMAVIGADDYTRINFPGVFIAGTYPNLRKDKAAVCSFPTQK